MKNRALSKVYLFALIIIMLIIFPGYKHAGILNPSYTFERITINDGLSQAEVISVIQDKKGYMWFATSDGLNMYDGNEFKIYRHKGEGKLHIASSDINYLKEDLHGNVWVATNGGLSKISENRRNIQSYFHNSDTTSSLSANTCIYIEVDSKGRVWVATENGLNLYDEKSDSFKRYFFNSNTDKDFWINSIEEGIGGILWIGTRNGLYYLEEHSKVIRQYKAIDEEKDVLSVLQTKDGKLWVSVRGDGVYIIDIKTHEVIHKTHEESHENSLPTNSVTSIMQDSKERIWLATKNGLSMYNKSGLFLNYYHEEDNSNSISSNEVFSIYEDESGFMWIGTDNGINRYNPNAYFYHIKKNDEGESISSNMVTDVYEDRDGLIWVGTMDGGLNLIDVKNGNIRAYRSSKEYDEETNTSNHISSDRVWTISEDKNGNIWIATSNGINKFDKNTGKFTWYQENGTENSIISNLTKVVYVDSRDIVWIGTTGGLCSMDEQGKITCYTELFKANDIDDNNIKSIYEDENGTMWIGFGNFGGLVKFDIENNTIKKYTYNDENNNSISDNMVNCITSDYKGNLWIGTSYGLNKFNIEKETFEVYLEKDGLANGYVYGIVIDNIGNVWFSTNGGISRYDIVEDRFINLNASDGLQSNEFNVYSYEKGKNGFIVFGGINGVNIIQPAMLTLKENTPDVSIKSINLNGALVDKEELLNLNYYENNLSIEFFFPEFRRGYKVQYSYMLEGFDDDWVFYNNKNYINYINIPPGKYKFLVKARGINGEWSNTEYVDIVIKKPFWKTNIAYTIYITIFLMVCFVIFKYVMFLDKLVDERTKELQNQLKENKMLYKKFMEAEKYKNNYFINLSHELRTPLNVILSTEQLISKLNEGKENIEKDKLSHYMSMLKRNSNRLLKLINNIIDTSKIDSGSYKLRYNDVDIVYLVEEIALSMKDFVESKGLELIIDPEIEELSIECDEYEIERCIVNLIGNAVKFTDKGSILLGIRQSGDNVIIKVEDTGIGIAPQNINSIFNRFAQAYKNSSEIYGGSGLGLTLTRQLVELHGGAIWAESEVGEGSKFFVKLPMKKHIMEK